jgi:hypothetical protein
VVSGVVDRGGESVCRRPRASVERSAAPAALERVASGRLGFVSLAVRRVVRLDVDAEAMVDEAVNEDDRPHDRETVASPAGTPDGKADVAAPPAKH